MWGEFFNLENPLIKADNTWLLWAICSLGAAGAIYLEQRYKWAAKMTGAIIALIFAIPLLLLQCDMRKIGRESGRILIIFLIGSFATACGSLLAYAALHNYIPELAELAGVFTGTYIGGTVNFAALGAAFDVSGNMISAATVADNLLMVLYFFVLIPFLRLDFSAGIINTLT